MTRNAKIGEFLKESRIRGSTGSTAKKITVKLYGKGVFAKQENRPGSENTSYYRRKAGQFIYSKLDFLNGAFGIIPEELDGYESTVDLPCFDFISPEVSPEWFLQFVSRSDFYSYQGGLGNGGRKARRISPDDFLDLEIEIPPFPEQKKIAEILSRIDRVIKGLRLKKEKIEFTKSAISLHIFKSLKDSGQAPRQVSDLQSLASVPISYGVLVPDNATREDGVPMIKIQDINQGKIRTERLTYISRGRHDRYAKTEVKTGDLLISLIGSIGITARVPDALEGANVSRQFAVIRTSNPGMSDYLHCFLRGASAQEKISFLSQGNAQKALNLDSLRGLEVPLKSNADMDRVVRICQTLDLTTDSISKQIDKAEKIRLSVASDLLSGRKRVSA